MRKGFTLIELLVVIAIIAILAAILFPVFERVKNKAQQAACISNLKQMTMATLMYAHDWDTMLWNWSSGKYNQDTTNHAAWGGMDGALYPYTQNEDIFFCPTVQGTMPGYVCGTNINGQAPTSGAYKVYGYMANGLWEDGNYNTRVMRSDWTGTTLTLGTVGPYPAKTLDYFNYPTH